ncbi:MAG: hypothetical protein IT490_09575 [Candidatus Contendobacter sp.]|nr:hypothetical protein [Candidatus Contendobacter sp.]RUQ29822.1 MAG: hypothetical protein EKK68_11275 [Candidatus Competibacteraceae bacterium]
MIQRTQNPFDTLREIRAFTRLTLDGRTWLLPQTEVQALEMSLDIDPEVRTPLGVGAIAFEGEWWPVYCLSSELRLLPHIPAGRRICPLLNNGADRFSLVCDQVETLVGSSRLHPVPACMASRNSPIQALVLLDQGLGCVTTTESIARLIATAEDRVDA